MEGDAMFDDSVTPEGLMFSAWLIMAFVGGNVMGAGRGDTGEDE